MRHPIAFASRIADWEDLGIQGPEAFENFVVRNLILRTVATEDLEHILPPFSEVRRIASTISLKEAEDAGATQGELLQLYVEDNSRLRAELEEEKATHEGLWREAESELNEAWRRLEESRSETYRLNQRVRVIESQFRARGDANPSTPTPADLNSLKDWAAESPAGSVIITNRALRGAKESAYEEPGLVYQSLLLLRDYYVPMRREGGDELTRQYEEGLRRLGLEDSGSITRTRSGEQGDEYFILHNGRRRELDRHLKKGNAREPRHCFRLYHFWDEEAEQLVVGWLTSHLETRAS